MGTVAYMERARLSEMVAFRVYSSLYQVVTDLAKRERRKLSEIELALFERGVAAFKRDGLLFEPEGGEGGGNSGKPDSDNGSETLPVKGAKTYLDTPRKKKKG